MDEARLEAFRTLKAPCVELSQVALRYKGKKATSKDLVKSLEALLAILENVSKKSNVLDPKLAEYAFFPLSHIFRDMKDLPVRIIEIALQCLHILIAHGWRTTISPDLGKQLLVLLSYLAGGSATDVKVKSVNEELSSAAFGCLAALFQASQSSVRDAGIVQSKDLPILGHAVTVMLDGVTDGPSVRVRLAALTTVDKMMNGNTYEEALKNVFPGIVSSLTKVLSPKSDAKPSYKVLAASLLTLTKVLCKVISDDKIDGLSEVDGENAAHFEKLELVKSSWATATAGQVKMALANILPLRYHDRSEVRAALYKLCLSILQQCRRSLSLSLPMLTDTLVILCSQSSETEAANIFALNGVLAANTDLLDFVKTSLHDWIVALPRIMQSNDDTRKKKTIEQIATSFRILQTHDVQLAIFDEMVATNLRASVSATIQASSTAIRSISDVSLDITQLLEPKSRSVTFNTVLCKDPSSKATMTELQVLVTQLKALPISTNLRQEVINNLRTSSTNEQLANLWLSLQLLDDSPANNFIVDQYLNLPPAYTAQQQMLDEVYSFSLDVLAKSSFEDMDRWQLQALALESVALQAQSQRYDFRPELVDALYPILERLGSDNAALQQQAMTCLNIVSNACDYPDSAALIIDNADYLVNAVALKLNTFDISPQAPQVLVMMIRLCGSVLIPYLDDLVESIFSIMACYHGYPKLVESLFSVLDAIVEEAAKTSSLAINSKSEKNELQAHRPFSIEELASLLRANVVQTTRTFNQPLSPPFPLLPAPVTDPDGTEPASPPRASSPPPVPPSKVDTLIISIASLTPSHLTTPSTSLRLRILRLLESALPVLASDIDRFLPIAATLWPAIAVRLYDSKSSDPSTTLAAANTLSSLCKSAGDFLASRAEGDWDQLCKLYRRVEKEMREETRVRGKSQSKEEGLAKVVTGRGMKWNAWNAVVGLLVVIAGEVGVTSEMEDDIFEMLGCLVSEHKHVRDVLEMLNADLLWLIEEKAWKSGQ